jgi:RNA polymerase sigma factor (sigma-70 family)
MNNWNTRITLLQRAKDPSDHKAWEEFVSYYKEFIKVILLKMNLNHNDLDDLNQEIVLRIWKVLPDYDQSQAKFRNWMSRIIRNKVIDHYRKVKCLSDKQDMIIEEGGNLTPLISEPETEAIVQTEWETYIVGLALERMSKHFTERAIVAFNMSMDNVASEEIAAHLGIKANSVNKLKNRVKLRIIQEIERLREDLEPSV